MELKGYETVSRNVVVSVEPMEVFERLKYHVMKTKLNLDTDSYIDREGRLVCVEEHHTSHSYFTTKIIDESPSQEIKDVLAALKIIRQVMLK